MKKAILLALLAAVSFCLIFLNIVAAFPPLPGDLAVAPDPASSLPKELACFLGKWEGKFQSTSRSVEIFLIVESIDKEKATATVCLFGGSGWERVTGEATEVTKEYGKWKIHFFGGGGRVRNILTSRGKYLDLEVFYTPAPAGVNVTLSRSP